ASASDDSRPRATRAKNAAPSAAPAATAETCTGSPGASAIARIHARIRVAPPVVTIRGARTPLRPARSRTTHPGGPEAARRRAAAGGHGPRRAPPGALDEFAHHNPRRLTSRPPQRRRVVGEVEPVEHATAVRVVQRGAFATQIRREYRNPPRIGGSRIRRC